MDRKHKIYCLKSTVSGCISTLPLAGIDRSRKYRGGKEAPQRESGVRLLDFTQRGRSHPLTKIRPRRCGD